MILKWLVLFVIIFNKAESQATPQIKLQECIGEFFDQTLPAQNHNLKNLVQLLDDFLRNVILPALSPIQRNYMDNTRIAFQVVIQRLTDSVATSKLTTNIKDSCKLTRWLKALLRSMNGRIAESRDRLRFLEHALLRINPLTFQGSEAKHLHDQLLVVFTQIDSLVLNVAECYINVYHELHCQNEESQEKFGESDSEKMELAEANDNLQECVCDQLKDDLQGKHLGNLLIDVTGLNDLPNSVKSQRDSAVNFVNVLRNAVNNGIGTKPDGLCEMIPWLKTFFSVVQSRIIVLRLRLRILEIEVVKRMSDTYMDSQERRIMDNLLDTLDDMERSLLKITFCYLDFFLFVHCNPEKCHCIIKGDPMVRTCDKGLIFLQGEGFFETVKVSQPSGACNEIFQVFLHVLASENQQIPVGLVFKSQTQNLIIDISDTQVQVNGTAISLPFYSGNIRIELRTSGMRLAVKNCGTFMVEEGQVTITVELDLRGKIQGLCGDYNGVAEASIHADMRLISMIFSRSEALVYGP